MTSVAPNPRSSETCEQYTIRAHRALLDVVTDPDDRNTMIWSAWAHANGQTDAEAAASRKFEDASKFVMVPNYCYFVEHATKNSAGDDVRYGVDDLEEITQTNNNRAADMDAFSALCDNHTSATDQSASGDPEVLGAVGAYRMGMVGRKDPKFAIFADEHQYASAQDALAKKPRRSVELITFHSTGERFIDPVACLGGRAPRLAMPAKYSVETYSIADPRLVDRYTMPDVTMSDMDFSGAELATDQYAEVDPRITKPPHPPRSGKKRKQSVAGKITPPPPPPSPNTNNKFEGGWKSGEPFAEESYCSDEDDDEDIEKFDDDSDDSSEKVTPSYKPSGKPAGHEYTDAERDHDDAYLDRKMAEKKANTGSHFSAGKGQGSTTEKNDAMAGGAAGPGMLPGGSNTYVKDTNYFDHEDHDSPVVTPENDAVIPSEDDMHSTLSDEDLRKIVNAFGNMPEQVWARQKMEEEQSGGIGGGMDTQLDPSMDDTMGMDEGLDEDLDVGLDPEVDKNAMMGEASGGSIVTPPAEDASYDDQQKFSASGDSVTTQFGETNMNQPKPASSVDRFAAMETEHTERYAALTGQHNELLGKHNALKNSHIKMLDTLGDVSKQMKKMQYEKINRVRAVVVDEVCEKYSAILDAEAERDRLLVPGMTDETFSSAITHLKGVGHRFEQSSVMRNSIPSGSLTSTHRGTEDGNVERNSAWFDKSQELATAAADKNEFIEWEALCDLTDKAVS